MLSHILYCKYSLLIPLVLRQVPLAVALYIFFNYKLEYFTEFHLFQAWTWRLTMLQIYVTFVFKKSAYKINGTSQNLNYRSCSFNLIPAQEKVSL